MMFDYVIVGAGFAGSVLAERLARDSNKRVLLLDRRPHVGGNAYDHYDEHGLLVHKYGPHIFHTNSRDVFDYLSQFTEWRPYQHRVQAWVDGQLLPIPINLDTVNRLYGTSLTSFELTAFFESVAERREHIRTSEDVIVSKVGRELYEKFFRNYTRKQWGMDPSELDAQVTARIPVRTNRDDRYFTDTYQAMPKHGFTRMFENMLAHRFETHDEPTRQPVAVINYPNDQPYTRVTEFKHVTGQVHPKTSLVYEFACDEGDPYYPVPRPENMETYKKYEQLAKQSTGVWFAGRLATYKYYNMDHVTAQALSVYKKITAASKPMLVPVPATVSLTREVVSRGVPLEQ
jgi:UDP-galactopyranose mutase